MRSVDFRQTLFSQAELLARVSSAKTPQLCIAHFARDAFVTGASGFARLRIDAVPCYKVSRS